MKLSLKATEGRNFHNAVARDVELPDEKILCNNVILPEEFNPHRVRLWVIGNEFGALFAVWAEHEQDAFDIGVDNGLMDSFAVDLAKDYDGEEDQDNFARLGNASEPFDLSYAWIQDVDLTPAKTWKLLCAFAEARGAGRDNLYS